MLRSPQLLRPFARWIAGRSRYGGRRRISGTRLRRGVEMLESRVLLSAAPAIVSLELQNDTGTSGDNVTSDATISGSVTNDGPVAGLTIEWDYDGDGIADRLTASDAMGNFAFDVGGDLNYGQQSVAARAMEWDPDIAGPQFGAWQSISFEYQPPANNPAEVTNLAVDGAGILTGSVSNDGPAGSVMIELDYDGDGIADQVDVSDSNGSFTHDVGAVLGYGEHTVAARATEWDANAATMLFGAWQSVTFNHQPPSNAPPGVINLQVDGDGILSGTVTNDGPVVGMMIELDYDGDGIAEATTLSDAGGSFSHNVGADLGSGQHTIAVRAVEWDMGSAGYLHGEWETVNFNFTPPNAAPQLLSFTVVKGAEDIWIFEGQVADDDMGTVVIHFGGVLAGHTAAVLPNGTFSYSVRLTPLQRGPVSAQAVDSGGLQSNELWDLIL